VPRLQWSAVYEIRGHPVVPAAGMRADARMVWHQVRHLGRGVCAIRDGHVAAVVQRQRRKRTDSDDQPGAGLAGQPADRPVQEAQVARVDRPIRDGQTERMGRVPRHWTARGLSAVPACVRLTERHGRVRPDQEVVGRPAVAKTVLLRYEKHPVRV